MTDTPNTPTDDGAATAGAATADIAGTVDLHTHSTASDGVLPPTAVVEAAHAVGLAAMALTDHDTVAGVAEAQAAGARLGVDVVAGVELSAHVGSDEIHLLALHLSDVGTIAGELARFRDDRVSRAEQMVARLNALGVPVTMDDVLREAGAGAVGRPHVARAVVARGGALDVRDAFDRFLGDGRPAAVEKPRLAARDAIALAHAAGGIAVWAHPGAAGRRDRVAPLVAVGLDGLEVLHPRHCADDRQRLNALVDFFGLVPSGGSD
ncbi:MAG TPA: PHP domain-containing protein, partial [Gemmatirosa sp.]